MAESALLRVKNCTRFGVDSQSDQIAMVQLYLFEAIEK